MTEATSAVVSVTSRGSYLALLTPPPEGPVGVGVGAGNSTIWITPRRPRGRLGPKVLTRATGGARPKELVYALAQEDLAEALAAQMARVTSWLPLNLPPTHYEGHARRLRMR